VTVVSVPLELGSDERGLAAAPAYLKQHGLGEMLLSLGRDVEQVEIACPASQRVASAGNMKHAEAIVAVAQDTRTQVEKAVRRGDTVIALGGDHSAALGSIAGAAAVYSSMGLIYIDAHPDCTTDTTTISGNVHGMIVSSALGQGNNVLTDLFTHPIRPENVLYIAIKDIDPPEIAFIRDNEIKYFTMLDIARDGLAPVAAAIERLSRSVNKVWVSLDLDSIDERFAPGVAMTTPDGLTRREIVSLAQHIGKACDIAGVDIVEILPAKDRGGVTAKLVLELIARLMGQEYSWYKEYMRHYSEINVANEREVALVRRAQAPAAKGWLPMLSALFQRSLGLRQSS